MHILCHRGYWLDPSEKNTERAFTRALKNGFGIEVDLRDLGGELVISHDIPMDGVMRSSRFIELYLANPVSSPIALNIKSDGLHVLVEEFIGQANFKNVFVFDMAVPDMRDYLRRKIPVYTRLSEYEQAPVLLNESSGVWLDGFRADWYGAEIFNTLLSLNKFIGIVSPELHGRAFQPLWNLIKHNNIHRNNLVALCTDFPMRAKEFFND